MSFSKNRTTLIVWSLSWSYFLNMLWLFFTRGHLPWLVKIQTQRILITDLVWQNAWLKLLSLSQSVQLVTLAFHSLALAELLSHLTVLFEFVNHLGLALQHSQVEHVVTVRVRIYHVWGVWVAFLGSHPRWDARLIQVIIIEVCAAYILCFLITCFLL